MAYMNPYLNNMYLPYQQNNIDQLYQQYQQLQQNNPYNPNTQPNNAVNNRGDYITVRDYQQVETTPARTDGVATLFFDFDNKIFYSKKLLNGKPSIQTFTFDFLNGSNSNDIKPVDQETTNPQDTPKIDYNEVLSELVNRFDKVERKLKKLEKQNKISKEEL